MYRQKKKMIGLMMAGAMALGAVSAFAEGTDAGNPSDPAAYTWFDVPVNTKVTIVSKAYGQSVLNVETNTVPQANDRVGVYQNTGDHSQRWMIVPINEKERLYRVESYHRASQPLDQLALNVYNPTAPNAPCTVYPWQKNNADDYTIKIVNEEPNNPIVSNTFGFVMIRRMLSMTATGAHNGADVNWLNPDGTIQQLWDINHG